MNIVYNIKDKWLRNKQIYAEAYRAGKIIGFDYTWLLWCNHTKYLLRLRNPKYKQKEIQRQNMFWESFLDVIEKYKDKPIYTNEATYCNDNNAIIWIFWTDPSNMPNIVESCIEQIKRNCNGNKVIVVTENSVTDYLHLDEVVWRKYREGKISRTHFCDIVRIALLAQYGGVWMDCTLLLTQPLPKIVTESDFYTNHLQDGDATNVSEGRWSTFFFACYKENLMMRATLDIFIEYWKRYDYIVEYVWMDYIFNLLYNHIPSVRNMIDAVPYNNPDIWIKQLDIAKPYTKKQYENLFTDESRFLYKFSCKQSLGVSYRDKQGNITLMGRICGEKD